MHNLEQRGLRTDISGMPVSWITYREAVRLYHLGQVRYTCGSLMYRVHGGVNALSGERRVIEVNSIIATDGRSRGAVLNYEDYIPPLSNEALFKRDAGMCMYCGEKFRHSMLSRDHVTPLSRGGGDNWNNVVTACKRCNNHKAGRIPEECGMSLLAIPFTPTYAEYLFLRGRRVLADQMEFLAGYFPRESPLRERIAELKKAA